MKNYLCTVDWPTLLAFAVTILTIIVTTAITIKNQRKTLEAQIAISRESAEREREKARVELICNSRQAWINALRDEVSRFISGTCSILDLFQQKEGRKDTLAALENPQFAMSELGNWSIRYGSALAGAEGSRTRIVLLLNPKEPPSAELMGTLDTALKAAKDGRDPSVFNSRVVAALQPILKSEWERIKSQDGKSPGHPTSAVDRSNATGSR